jgi:hypothetical protein
MMFADNNGQPRVLFCSAVNGSGQFRPAFQVNDTNFNTIAVVPFSK